ncbi:hypothetical protein D3C81_1898300 [compost metagenome]
MRVVAQAKAAPVGRDHVPVAGQLVDDELERGGHVHPAVHHEQDGRPYTAPVAHVRAGAANVDEFGTGKFHGFHRMPVLKVAQMAPHAVSVDSTAIKVRPFDNYTGLTLGARTCPATA